jgi:hypothetical protein
MERIARCSCGQLTTKVQVDPVGIVACHCLACQRRTGSPFGLGAYFNRHDVHISGVPESYVRPTDAGFEFTSHFCRTCGTSLYWSSGKNPDLIGIAVGAFADPSFPPPTRSVWERFKHSWLDLGVVHHHFPQGRV